MKLKWSREAREQLEENTQYVLKNWGKKSATDFLTTVIEMEFLLENNAYMYPEYRNESIRKAILTKHVSLYYEILGQEIYVLAVRSNFMNNENYNPKQ